MSLWNSEDGSGNSAPFSKLKQVVTQNISSTWSQQVNILTAPIIETYYCRTDAFKNYFFPYTIVEWNKLDFDIQKSKSYAIFWNALLKIGQPNQCSIYRIHNPVGLKLNEHRFNHNFQSFINLHVVVALQLNQPHIFYCTTIISQIFAQLS